ncbi:MAG: hypothetical protein JWL95_3226 [Gemmatimonadetes bacterium]|nr:hypothetical protein [Gemmatimonadota bacterium]
MPSTPPKPPPRVVVVDGRPVEPSAVYIKVPAAVAALLGGDGGGLSPELAELVSGHLERGAAFVGLVSDVLGAARALAEAAAAERAALERTHRKLTGAKRRRRRP